MSYKMWNSVHNKSNIAIVLTEYQMERSSFFKSVTAASVLTMFK